IAGVYRMTERDQGISRREFITRLTVLGSLAASYPAAALERLRSNATPSIQQNWLDQDPWQTIAAVQQHLFPATEESPGASDFQAIVYLRNSIDNPAADGEDKAFIVSGVGWLDDLTREQYQRSFTALDESERETVLRQIEQSKAGRNWLSLLVTYLLEALLADPVYGGNPDGIGWKWLGHQPGYPTPPEDKSWYKLAAPVRYQRKG
ncbi:MAG: gluconate 2-dehydrogenase subunit 3 family protein, partial [Pseudomonadota bacterium]|nr:gluconate 2-dehydrogenase subunit 3 family protein [Pseudomonadota bacterium]